MLAAAHLGELVYPQILHAEHGARAAGAAGLKLGKLADVFDGEQLRLDPAVHAQGGVRLAGGLELGRHAAHPLGKGGDVLPQNGKARGKLVAAVAFQQIGHLR